MRISDWSSDVCSSDLKPVDAVAGIAEDPFHAPGGQPFPEEVADGTAHGMLPSRPARRLPMPSQQPRSRRVPHRPRRMARSGRYTVTQNGRGPGWDRGWMTG